MTMQPDRKPTSQPSFSEEFGNALEYGWGPILVSLLFSAALALPDPSHEALMSVAENATRSGRGMVSAGITAVSFFFLPPTLHMFTRLALETPRHFGTHRAQIEAVILTWVGRLPLIAVVIAGMKVLVGEDSVSCRAQIVLAGFIAVCGIFALSGIWVFLSPGRRLRIARALSGRGRGPVARLCGALVWLYRTIRDAGTRNQIVAASAFALVLTMLTMRPQWSVWLGPITVTIIFVSLAAMALAALTRLTARFAYGQVPLALLLAGLVMAGTGQTGALVFMALMLIYGFTVWVSPGGASRPQQMTAGLLLAAAIGLVAWGHLRRDDCGALAGCYLVRPAPVASSDMATAYAAWLAARPAEDGPVRLIAAEGGGLFSAYYTALYLAKRADTEGPGFARSIFAISGVSGGSVGAATFWAIARSGVCDAAPPAEGCHQKLAREILGSDFLTPVLARMFTSDLADRLLPFSSVWPGARQDRARQLELALETRTAAAIAKKRQSDGDEAPRDLAGPLASGWSPDAGVPALFLNTTRVWDGGRLMLSPFDRMTAGEDAEGTDGQMAGAGLAVSTAAFMSARFPVVTAAARLQDERGQVRQIVDGGYFDNSGMETINDILEVIRPLTPDHEIAAISLTTQPPAAQEGGRDAIRGTFGTPLGAFLGAWRSRLTTVWKRLESRWTPPGNTSQPPTHLPLFKLPLIKLNYTVSWFLDHTTFCRIEQNLNNRMLQTSERRDPATLSEPESCPSLPETGSQQGSVPAGD